jgi:hypothetical protein
VAALAALLLVVAGAVAIGGGGASANHASLTARAGPFAIAYRGPWRSVTGAVPGGFAVKGSAARNTSASGASSGGQQVHLVSGQASLAAGQLIASASVPGGIPPALVDRYGRPLALVDAQVAGHRGREYTWSSAGRRVIVYVLPTATSDAAIICQAPNAAAAALRACAALAGRAHTSTKQILAPGPDRVLALAITGPLQAVKAARSTVGRLRGSLAARRQRAATISRTEAHATAFLAKLAPPPRYRKAVAQMTRALGLEAKAFAALARAAGSDQRHAYASAAGHISAASHAVEAAARRLQVDQLRAPTLGPLHLAGPPPAPQPGPAITAPSQSQTSPSVTSGSSASPPPPASGGSGNGTSTTYVTPFS